MVKNCVAANCSNTYGHGVSLFKFPKDRALRQKWIKNVQKTRANWDGPSEHSVLCSQHFESSCFEVDSALAAQMGIQKRKRLKPDAVPTVFDRPAIHTEAESCRSRSRSLSRSCSDLRSLLVRLHVHVHVHVHIHLQSLLRVRTVIRTVPAATPTLLLLRAYIIRICDMAAPGRAERLYFLVL
jgi:hypothetical protein